MRGPNAVAGLRSKLGSRHGSLVNRAHQQPKDVHQPVKQGTLAERLRFGLYVTFSFRHPGTPYEISNVPPFSTKDPRYEPPRGRFCRWTSLSALSCYLLCDLLNHYLESPLNGILYSLKHIPLFSRWDHVTRDELVVRLAFSMGIWATMYFGLRFLQDVLALIAVMTGLSEVSQWRPAFGSPLEAWSLRRFWGYMTSFPVAHFPLIPFADHIAHQQRLLASTHPPQVQQSRTLSHSQHLPATIPYTHCTLHDSTPHLRHFRSDAYPYRLLSWHDMAPVSRNAIILPAGFRNYGRGCHRISMAVCLWIAKNVETNSINTSVRVLLGRLVARMVYARLDVSSLSG